MATKLLRIPENSDDAWPICRPLRKGMERLVTAYQETLLSLEELRTRMPELRRREQTLQAELTSITKQTNDRANYLRLTETLTAFMTHMRSSAQTLDIAERQRIVRLLVKEVLVGDDTITIRHSIPIPTAPSGNDAPPASGRVPTTNDRSYLLRKGSKLAFSAQSGCRTPAAM